MLAKNIKVDDVLEVPGWMLHEDLAGLIAEVKVKELRHEKREKSGHEWIGVVHPDGETVTWWRPEERVFLKSRKAKNEIKA